jgi:hypothetical protein
MSCAATPLDSTRIQLFGYCGDDTGVYILVVILYGMLLLVRQLWWAKMAAQFRISLSYPAYYDVHFWGCRCKKIPGKRQRQLWTVVFNEFINCLLYIVNLFLIVESQTLGMILATVIGSSLGAGIAYAIKKKDKFHLLDLLEEELREGEGESLRLLKKALRPTLRM